MGYKIVPLKIIHSLKIDKLYKALTKFKNYSKSKWRAYSLLIV